MGAQGRRPLSRGPGRLQRAVIAELGASDGLRLSRRSLEETLVTRDGHDPSNILRAIRGLARTRRVALSEGRSVEDSFVALPSPARTPLSDDEIRALLAEAKR